MQIKPHFLTTYYKLPSNIWILAIPTVRIAISFLFRYSLIEYLKQLWIDISLLSAVFILAYLHFKFLKIKIEDGFLTVDSGIFINLRRETALCDIEYIEVLKNPFTSLFKAKTVKLYTNSPPRGKAFFTFILNEDELAKLKIKEVVENPYQSRWSDLLKYSIIETNPLTGVFLAYSITSIISDILGTDYSRYFNDGVSIISSVAAVVIPPFVAVILSIIAIGYVFSLISFLSSLYSFKETTDGSTRRFRYGFIFKTRAIANERAIVGTSGKCGFFGALFSVWGDGYNLRTTKKRLLKIDSTPPGKNGATPSLWGSYLYLRAPLILMGVIILVYLILRYFNLGLPQVDNILFILAIFAIYFLAERILLFIKSRVIIKRDEVLVVSGRWLSFDYRRIEKDHIYRIKEGSSPFMRQKNFYNYEIYIEGAKTSFLYAVLKKKLIQQIKGQEIQRDSEDLKQNG